MFVPVKITLEDGSGVGEASPAAVFSALFVAEAFACVMLVPPGVLVVAGLGVRDRSAVDSFSASLVCEMLA